MTNFDKYKALKDLLNIEYKGIHLNKVMAIDIWNMANSRQKISYKKIFLCLFYLDLSKLNIENSLLITYGMHKNRPDYVEIVENVLSKIGKTDYYQIIEAKRKLKISFKNYTNNAKYVFKVLRKANCSLLDKLKLISIITYYTNTIDILSKIDFSLVTKYLAFSSVHDVECLLTQYLQQKKVKTYSLQHGAYYIYDKSIPIDVIAYENFTSDVHLAWGEYTAKEFAGWGIPSKKIHVAGHPCISKIESISPIKKIERGLVLLTRLSYQESNFSLIKILHQSEDLLFQIKLHPSLDLDLYRAKYSYSNIEFLDNTRTLNELLKSSDFDFAIVVNSTSYYEALTRGLPTFRFSDNSFDLMYGYDDIFSSAIELKRVIEKIRTDETYNESVKKMLEYVLGIGIDNYRKELI